LQTVRNEDGPGSLGALLYRSTDSGHGDINPRMLRIHDRWVFPVPPARPAVHPQFGKNAYAIKRQHYEHVNESVSC
jgi:hypothetical protein